MTADDLRVRFSHHPPNAEKAARHAKIRDLHLALAAAVANHVPGGREQALALTKLEESMFWCNAGIAREGA